MMIAKMGNLVAPRIVGGMFGLHDIAADGTPPPFMGAHNVLLANARSGLYLLVHLLSPPRVWVPSYLCDVLVKAVQDSELVYYQVDDGLAIPSLGWLDKVGYGDLVLVIDYFGFPVQEDLVRRVQERDAWVVEDAAQALLSEQVGRAADFVLFSPRKFLGVPDGGILVVNGQVPWANPELRSAPADWWLKACEASVRRREFDLYGGDRTWFQLFRETDVSGPIGLCAMSELSKMLMVHSFDYAAIGHRRIENYRALHDRLQDWALYPELPAGVVPLGFPIRLRERDSVRQTLFEHEIYPPVHWPLKGIVPRRFESSHLLASEIMTLPCDQRYEERDMKRMGELVLSEVRRHALQGPRASGRS